MWPDIALYSQSLPATVYTCNQGTNKRDLQEEALFQWESTVFHQKCDKPIVQHETQDILSPHSVYKYNTKPPLSNTPTQ